MKMSKAFYIATISIIIFVSIIMITLGIILFKMVDKEERLIKDAEIVRQNYTKLSTINYSNQPIIIDLNKRLSNFSFDTLATEHKAYLNILDNYTDNINEAENIYNNLNKKCNAKYKDITTPVFCSEYPKIYEEMINIYINNINTYNEKITNYNEHNDIKYQQYNTKYQEYLDIDQDGMYKGKQ